MDEGKIKAEVLESNEIPENMSKNNEITFKRRYYDKNRNS